VTWQPESYSRICLVRFYQRSREYVNFLAKLHAEDLTNDPGKLRDSLLQRLRSPENASGQLKSFLIVAICSPKNEASFLNLQQLDVKEFTLELEKSLFPRGHFDDPQTVSLVGPSTENKDDSCKVQPLRLHPRTNFTSLSSDKQENPEATTTAPSSLRSEDYATSSLVMQTAIGRWSF